MRSWQGDKAMFWEKAPFFRLLLPFAAGILLYEYIPFEGISFWPVLVAILFLFISTVVLCSRRDAGNGVFVFAAVWLFLASAGYGLACFSDARHDASWFGRSLNSHAAYLARLDKEPLAKERSWKLEVHMLGAVDDSGVKPVDGKAFVYVRRDDYPMLFHEGDTIIVPGRWETIRDAGNPFEFSYATYCRHNNIWYRQWCDARQVRLFAPHDPRSWAMAERVHLHSMRRLGYYLRGHAAMGLLQAMLLGDETNLDPDLRNKWADTGIVHIIAISGGNITIFFLALSFLLGWIRNKRLQWVKYVAALPLVWFYVIVAGSEPSAVRAAVMFSLLSVGVVLRRNGSSLNHLLATAFVLLAAQPSWLFSIGFQLSFLAVLSILLFYRPIAGMIPVPPLPIRVKATGIASKIVRWIANIPLRLWQAVAVSIAAEILVAPVSVFIFHAFPLMFAIANLAAYLFMGFVLVLGLLLLLVAGWPVVAAGLAAIIVWLTQTFGGLVDKLQGLGPRSFNHLSITPDQLFLIYLLLGCAVAAVTRRSRQAVVAILAVACLLVGSFCSSEWRQLHQRAFVVYNIPHVLHAELLTAKTFSVLASDTIQQARIDYVTQAAHTGWQSWKKAPTNNKVFVVGGRSVLLLDGHIDDTVSFHTDVLVVGHGAGLDVDSWCRVFSPAEIVAGGDLDKKQLESLAVDCKHRGIAFHATTTDGAFILSD